MTKRNSGDDFVAIKSRLKKVSPPRNHKDDEKLELFPMQQRAQSSNNKGIESSPTRHGIDQDAVDVCLGACGKFPSFESTFDPAFSADDWDPLYDEEKRSDYDDKSWAVFGGEQKLDRYPVDAYEGIAMLESQQESTFQDTLNTSIDALLENKDSALRSRARRPDIRKAFARGGHGSAFQLVQVSNRDIFKKPRLLGPLLVERFTRSYWRRLEQQGSLVNTAHLATNQKQPVNDESNSTAQRIQKSLSDDVSGPAMLDAKENCTSGASNRCPETKLATSKPLVRRANEESKPKNQILVERYSAGLDKLDIGILDMVESCIEWEPLSVKDIQRLQTSIPKQGEEEETVLGFLKESVPSDKGIAFLAKLLSIQDVRMKLDTIVFCKTFPDSMAKFSSGEFPSLQYLSLPTSSFSF